MMIKKALTFLGFVALSFGGIFGQENGLIKLSCDSGVEIKIQGDRVLMKGKDYVRVFRCEKRGEIFICPHPLLGSFNTKIDLSQNTLSVVVLRNGKVVREGETLLCIREQ